MTEKRFRFNGRTNCIEYDNESILLDSYGEDIEELLNALNDENEQLKNLCKTLIKHIEKKSIAFIIDDEIKELLK